MNKSAKKYIKKIKRGIVGSAEEKKKYVEMINELISDLLEEEPDASYETICEKLGPPEEKSEEFMGSLDSSAIKKAFSWKKAVIIGIIIALVAWGIGVAVASKNSYDSRGAYGVESPPEDIVDYSLTSQG